jgi:hypothetical protein
MKVFTPIPALYSDAEAAVAIFRNWADVVLLTNHSIGRCSVDRAGAKVVDLRRLKVLTHAKMSISRSMKVVKPSFQVVTLHAEESSMCVLMKSIIVSSGHLIAILSPAPMTGVLRLMALVLWRRTGWIVPDARERPRLRSSLVVASSLVQSAGTSVDLLFVTAQL